MGVMCVSADYNDITVISNYTECPSGSYLIPVTHSIDNPDGYFTVDEYLSLLVTDCVPPITYTQAGQLIGAVALLFSVAFIFRSIRKQMGF